MHIVHSLTNVSLNILQNKAVPILPLYCYRAQCVSALSISASSCGFMQHKWRNGKALLPELAVWVAVQCSSFAERASRQVIGRLGKQPAGKAALDWAVTDGKVHSRAWRLSLSQPKISVNGLSETLGRKS